METNGTKFSGPKLWSVKENFRHLLYEFNRDSKAAEAARNICAVYEDSIAELTAQKWFARFKQGNFDTSDTPRSGRPCCASGGILGGSIHYELLESKLTVTPERYCQQLRRLEEAIQQKRPGRRHGLIL
ncbi:MAG: hypothetical protein LBQ43_04120 [Holosporales bacterium]|nr:hypothetical protein [Holosporales bacterium]